MSQAVCCLSTDLHRVHQEGSRFYLRAYCVVTVSLKSTLYCAIPQVQIAVSGEGGIRMAWGSTQEASALFSVIHLFPDSQLQEVGLCWVDQKSQIPPEWGIRTEDLPPLGASPDGLIRHRAKTHCPSPPAPPVRDGLLSQYAKPTGVSQAQATSDSGPSQAHTSKPESSAAQSSTAQPVPAQLSASAQPSTNSTSSSGNDASLSEFDTLLAKLEISSQKLANQPPHSGPSPPPGLPSSVTQLSTPSSSGAAAPSSLTADSTSSVHEAAAAAAAAADTSKAPESAQATAPEQAHCQEEWLEAVEIKNVCPFREVRGVSSSGKARRLYRLSDPGPYARVCIPYQLRKQIVTVLVLTISMAKPNIC